ncbi:hypothetical protein M0R72_17930 [Candidatus Pacearchaeota archaeon]|jgi:hypothetical protein|nr:hypothetical protein [Candidatus Pacearchaeota archaeon]
MDLSLFATAGQLQQWADEELDSALAEIQKQPLTTLDAIEEALAGKVDSWTYHPAWPEGWATSEEDCAHLMAWEPVECRIHSRGRNGSPTMAGVTLRVLFPRCTEAGKCPCGAACREVP